MQGAVLAGGDSRRMGSDKAEIPLNGEPLWRRQIRVLRDAGAERVMLVRKPGQPAPGDVAVRRDRASGAGPMAGLHAALIAASAPWVAVLAVDMPGIDAAWFRRLRGFCRPGAGAMVRHARACEPLAAIYPAEAIVEITARLGRRDLSLQRLALALAAAGRMALLPLADSERICTVSVNTAVQLKIWQK
jgi:molybdenum cofactor guanylyltransferase